MSAFVFILFSFWSSSLTLSGSERKSKYLSTFIAKEQSLEALRDLTSEYQWVSIKRKYSVSENFVEI